jgi:hypothetical protein
VDLLRDPRSDIALEPGSIVCVHAADGSVLGEVTSTRAVPSQRMLSRVDEAIDAAFIRRRLRAPRSRVVGATPPPTNDQRGG